VWSRSRIRRRILFGLLAALALGAATYLKREVGPPDRGARPVSQQRFCVRVIDGDTIELDGGERVRLIGVDTPETVDPRRPVQYFGKEASAFTRRMAEGRNLRLEQDQETRDRYGRTLAYVYLQDGTFLNAEIIRQGYGHAYTRFPFRYERQFVALEREARESRRGLWAH
jgi:micrococcal nuclease